MSNTTNGEYVRLHTSNGHLNVIEKGDVGNLDVWCNPKCLSNIISLDLAAENYLVTMDTTTNNSFKVNVSESHVLDFARVTPGLCLFDTTTAYINKLRRTFSFLNTVPDKISFV